MLLAGFQMDEKVLVGIVVVHVHGHVKIQPAEQIDRLHKGAEINERIAVRHEADDVFHLLHELLHALFPAADRAVGRVDLRHIVGRRIGVARDAQKADAALVPVERQEKDRIGSHAVLVRAAEKYRAAARNTLKVIRISHRRFADDHHRDDRKQDDRDKKPQKAPFAAALFLFRLLFRLLQRFGAVLGGIGNVVLFLLRLVRVVGIVFAVLLFVFFAFLVRGALLALALGVVGIALRIVGVPAGVVGVALGIVFFPRFRREMPSRGGIFLRRSVPVGEIVLLRCAVPIGRRSVCIVALFHGVSFLKAFYDIR